MHPVVPAYVEAGQHAPPSLPPAAAEDGTASTPRHPLSHGRTTDWLAEVAARMSTDGHPRLTIAIATYS